RCSPASRRSTAGKSSQRATGVSSARRLRDILAADTPPSQRSVMIRITSIVAALALGAVAVTQASAHPAEPGTDTVGTKVFAIHAQNGSGESGTVALQPFGKKTEVEIHLLGAPKGPQPAHIHAGTCSKLDPTPKYPLSNVNDGFSETLLDVP